MDRNPIARLGVAAQRQALPRLKSNERLTHIATMLERHTRVQRVIEAQRAHRLRRS